MRKKTFTLLLFLILISCVKQKSEVINLSNEKSPVTKNTNLKQTPKIAEETKFEIEPYDYDTILKNNFHLSYRVYKDTIENQTLQSLTLVKEKKDIKQISETSFPMLHKNLGYIGADFGETFLFVQSFGSGNPHEIQLIEKENGKIITEGVLVDSNEIEKVLLYIRNEHGKKEKLILLDIKNNREKIITDFNNLKCSNIGGLRNCILIDTVTKNEIIIKTESEEDNLKKKYSR